MAVELRWIANSTVNAFYVAAALAKGLPTIQPKSLAAVREPAEALALAIAELDLPAAKFFDRLVPLAAKFDDDRLLAGEVLEALRPRHMAEATTARMAGLLANLKRAQDMAQPKLAGELKLRSGPLGEQWEARGPGLLAAVRRLTDRELLVERADILAVYPITGGGGAAYPANRALAIEAVLTNPLAELPEVVRLGWLIGQLRLDVPRFSQSLRAPRRTAALAMIPPTLAAAQEVELVHNGPATWQLALRAWQPGGKDESAAAEGLDRWWQAVRDEHRAWPEALAVLEQMLVQVPAKSENARVIRNLLRNSGGTDEPRR